MKPVTRRELFAVGLGLAAFPSAGIASLSPQEFVIHHDHIIGTSLDVHIVASAESIAQQAEDLILDEIERLRQILSIYDPLSELSQVNRSWEQRIVSADLAAVLRAYEHWYHQTHGIIHSQMGAIARRWKNAEAANTPPDTGSSIHEADRSLLLGWHLDGNNRLTRHTDQPFDLNALGKAYIIDRCVDAVRQYLPTVTGLLINLGGDIRAWGTQASGSAWVAGVQNPLQPYDNAAPLTALPLHQQSIAGSGGYLRYYTIDGQRYSHVLDPRNGRPSDGVAGVAVVAGDTVTANALATALCVLSPAEGLKLIDRHPDTACMIIASDGTRHVSPNFVGSSVQGKITTSPVSTTVADAWPEGYQVTVSVELPKIDAKRYRRPYVAVWIEDDKGKTIRTLGVWGKSPKYLKDLSDWWKIGKNDQDLVKAVAGATRGPGKYDLVWDGKDQAGTPLPQGAYTVRVEVHREFGAHLRQTGKIECLAKPASTKLEKNAETAETVIEFKKAEKN